MDGRIPQESLLLEAQSALSVESVQLPKAGRRTGLVASPRQGDGGKEPGQIQGCVLGAWCPQAAGGWFYLLFPPLWALVSSHAQLPLPLPLHS